MNDTVEREICAQCHELRPRSTLRLATGPGGARVLACHDWYGCYQRFRAWMIREGYWTVDSSDRKLYPVGRNRTAYQAAPDGPVLWTWAGEGQVVAAGAA